MKRCRNCQQNKPLSSFGKHKGTRDGLQVWCKPCCVEADRKRRRKNPIRYSAYQWKNRLKRVYDLSEQQYNDILAAQNNGCAVCGAKKAAKGGKQIRLHVDHCHKNNVVRGLLCNLCNRGLALFKDEPRLLRKAARYLEQSNAF